MFLVLNHFYTWEKNHSENFPIRHEKNNFSFKAFRSLGPLGLAFILTQKLKKCRPVVLCYKKFSFSFPWAVPCPVAGYFL